MLYEEALKKARHLAEKYAEKDEGIRFNPDREHVEGLLEEMARNHVEFGARYCPCMTKRITGDKKVDAKRSCPCIWHKEDIKNFGTCYCGLFVSADFDPQVHNGIPVSEWKKYS